MQIKWGNMIKYTELITNHWPTIGSEQANLVLDSDASAMHFSHNDALIITMIISNYRVSKVLVVRGSVINILYVGALDRMEDTLETIGAMINPQTQSHLYGFDGNEIHSPDTISLPVCAYPYNVIMKFYMPHNAVLG